MANTARPKTERKSPPPPVDHRAIAARAFELFAARGAEHGHDLDDWLTAERELAPTPSPRRRTRKAD